MLSDGSLQIMTIDGDEFAEADYGLVVDNSNQTQDLNQRLDTLAQAALQNQSLSFSTIMRLYSSASLLEKQRMIEKDERDIQERQAQAQQQQNQIQQNQIENEARMKEQELEQEDRLNERDNETKLLIAQISAAKNAGNDDGIKEPVYSQEAKDKLAESMRQFDKKLQLEKDKLSLERKKAQQDYEIKKKQANRVTVSKTK